MQSLGINVMRNTRCTTIEEKNNLWLKIKEDFHRWRYVSDTWAKRFNIEEMSVGPEWLYRSNTVS